jgi:hypothetical protein
MKRFLVLSVVVCLLIIICSARLYQLFGILPHAVLACLPYQRYTRINEGASCTGKHASPRGNRARLYQLFGILSHAMLARLPYQRYTRVR